MDLYYKEAITWSVITSAEFSSRYYGKGFLFDHAAASYFAKDNLKENYILGFLNTTISQYMLNVYNPTLNTGADILLRMPVILKIIEGRK